MKLIFTSERLKNPVTATARVQNRTEEEDSRRYGFRFLDGEKLDAQLPPAPAALSAVAEAIHRGDSTPTARALYDLLQAEVVGTQEPSMH